MVPPKKPLRSTVMFQGNYKEELRKTLDVVEAAIENDLKEHFTVDSVLGGNNNLKVRIDDTERGIERIVNCVFWHHHADVRYGYINVELVMTGFGMKSKTHVVGRFSVTDREAMKKEILKDIVLCVKH